MSFGKPYIMGIPGCIHDGWLLLRNNQKVFDLKFLCHMLGTDHMLLQYKAMAAGSTVNNLNKDLVSNAVVKVPSKQEQVRIGAYLEKFDTLITLHQRKYNKLQNLKKYFLEKMFPQNGNSVPEIRFAGFTGDWEQRKLTDLLQQTKGAMKIGPFGSALKKETYVENGVKVYAQENIFQEDFSIGDYYVTEQKYRELQSCELFPGDVVLSMMGTIGACAIFPVNAEKGIMNSHLLRLQFGPNMTSNFAKLLIKDTPQIKLEIDRLSVGSIMTGLSSSVVKKLILPVPSISEQKKIAGYFETLDHIITLHQCMYKMCFLTLFSLYGIFIQ